MLDDRAAALPDNPFAVIPSGIALGEIIAIPRGELGLFYFRTLLAVVSVTIAMRVMAKILAASGVHIQAADGAPLSGHPEPETPDQEPGLAYAAGAYGHENEPSDARPAG